MYLLFVMTDPLYQLVLPPPGLSEFLVQRSKLGLSAQLSSLTLAKCFRARLWEDSPYVSKQLEKIGGCMSASLVVNTSYQL